MAISLRLVLTMIPLFSQVFPDYRDRVVRHEAAHFLAGYLVGVPVTGYGLDIGQVSQRGICFRSM